MAMPPAATGASTPSVLRYTQHKALLRLDVFSEGLVHNPAIVLALHPEDGFDLAQAILVAYSSYK